MSHRERRTEECRKLFEGFHPQISTACRNPARVLQIAELAAQGYFSAEIAEMVGITPKAVQKIFRYYNFPSLHNFAQPIREERQNWKGGVKIVKGYEYVRTPAHPNRSKHGGYVAKHRLVVEKHLGRYLTAEEVVDHIDGDISNNNIENLRVFENNAEHLRVTLKGRTPNWSEDGKRRISEAVKAARLKENATRPRKRNDAGQYK